MLDGLRNIDIDKDKYTPLTNYNASGNGKILNINTLSLISGSLFKIFLFLITSLYQTD